MRKGNLHIFVIQIIGLVFHENRVYGQSFCGTAHHYGNTLANAMLKSGNSLSGYSNNCNNYIVNIKFHIVRNTSGTGGQSPSVIQPILHNLRNAFSNHGIFFNNLGYDFIDNSTYTSNWGDGCDTKFNNLISINNASNALNIYLLENDDWNMGKASGIPGTSVVIGGMYNTTPMVTSNVLVHEVGHLLNLFHTFHGCEGGGTDCDGNPVPSECLENPNGSNGTTCGDFVADTPADPFINNLSVNSSCNWDGTVASINGSSCGITGATYTPLTNNIMSYVPPACMSSFTPGQGDRSRLELEYGSVLSAVSWSQNTPYLQDMLYGTSGNVNNFVNTVNSVSASTWYIVRTNNPFNTTTSWTPSTAIAGYVSGPHEYTFQLSPGQSVMFTLNVSNSCGTSQRHITFTTGSSYKVFPNPAKEKLTISFDETPGKGIKSVHIAHESAGSLTKIFDLDDRKLADFLKNKEIAIDISGFKRGLYYVIIEDSENQKESIRVLFE